MRPFIRHAAITLSLLIAFLPDPAFAYIGPGAGLGAIAVTFALIFGLALLIIGLVWYPLKRRLKRTKKGTEIGDKNTGS